MSPLPAQTRSLAKLRKRHKVASGKQKQQLHKQISKAEADIFAAGWAAYDFWLNH